MFRRLRRGVKNRMAPKTCPYCFDRFDLAKTPFRCESDPGRCELEVDQVLEQGPWRHNSPVKLNKVVPPPGSITDQATCPSCSERTRERLCPTCHMKLPYTIASEDSLVIAMIGGPMSGKTHYIATLIHELDQRIAPDFRMTVDVLDDETMARGQEFRARLFDQRRELKKTLSAAANRSVRTPMVYSLKMAPDKTLFGGTRYSKTITLSFFDTAGDDLRTMQDSRLLNRYIGHADGLILLVDPLQIRSVRQDLPPGTPLPSQDLDPLDLVKVVITQIRREQRLPPDAAIEVPIAVTYSKLDAVEDLFPPDSDVLQVSEHEGYFDASDFEAVSSQVARQLRDWGERGLVNTITQSFPNHGFFAASSLGCTPDAAGQVARVVPHRVADPFLWLLWKKGLIQARKR